MILWVAAHMTFNFSRPQFHMCSVKTSESNLQGCHQHEIRQCAPGLVPKSALYSPEHQLRAQEVHFQEKVLLCT